jgi:hypothetical protein
MFSSNRKRSVATLGVVMGLLAAAVPAGAQGAGADPTKFVVDGPFTAKAAATTGNTPGGGDDTLAVVPDAGPGDDNLWNNGDGNDRSADSAKPPSNVVVLIGANDYGFAEPV